MYNVESTEVNVNTDSRKNYNSGRETVNTMCIVVNYCTLLLYNKSWRFINFSVRWSSVLSAGCFL